MKATFVDQDEEIEAKRKEQLEDKEAKKMRETSLDRENLHSFQKIFEVEDTT